jgi:hypothetical protein
MPGSAGLIMRKRLWLGPDHILMVRSHVLSEEYRRFYFADIEALVVAEVESPPRFYGAVLSVIAAVLTLGLIVAGHAITAVVCGLIGIGLTVFTFTRPLVRCSLKTRVSREFLPSLKRLETARRVIAMLKTEIENVQGALGVETFSGHSHAEGPTMPPPLRPYKGGMHYAAFAAMFAVVLLTPLRLNFPSTALANTLAGTHISMVVLAIVAAVKQHGTSISRAARTVVALTLAWAATSFVTEQVIVASTIQAAFRNPMSFDYWRDPIWDVAVANAVAYAVFGLVGLFALMSHNRPAPAA